jgi:RNA polymerase sigma factor (sigma-70 family)
MEWTSQAVRGSTGAFARVYERHQRALYRYCRSLLGDDEEARDALQSTMTKAFAALRFEERDFELRPWLFRIAHNEAVSRLRERREAVELDLVPAIATDSLTQAVEDRERLAQLRADLRELPERQRAALVMRELSGLGHAEIAAVLGGSPQTVKQTIFAARTALHECAEGRDMRCAEVQRVLSDGDGRTLRGRRMRAHVRSCRSCREFAAALAERPRDLAALAPVAAAGTWLSRLLATLGGSGGAAGTLATKTAAVVAASATIAGATTAVREVTRAERRAAAAAPARSRPAAPPREPARSIATAERSRPVQLEASATATKRRRAASGSGKRPDAAAVSVKPLGAAAVAAKPSDAAAVSVKPPDAGAVAAKPSDPAAKPPDAAPPAAPKPARAERANPSSPAAPKPGQAKRADPAAHPHGPHERTPAAPKPGNGGDDAPGHSGAPPGQGPPPAKAPPAPPGLAVANATGPNGPPADPGASGRAHNQK